MSSICSGGVAELAQRTRDGLVDDGHRAAADQLLHLHQTEVGLDAGGVAVHHQADGAGGRQHAGLAVAHAVLLAVDDGRRPTPRGRPRRSSAGTTSVSAICVVGVAVHAQHVEHVRLVVGEAGERAHAAGGAGAGGVGVAGHQRGERRGPGPTLVASRRAGRAPSAWRRGWRSRCRAGGTCGCSHRSARSGSRPGRPGSPAR